jgi:flagellar hook-length control protein FliK
LNETDDRNADADQREDALAKRSDNRPLQQNTNADAQHSSSEEENNQNSEPRTHKARAPQKVLTPQEQIEAALMQAMSPLTQAAATHVASNVAQSNAALPDTKEAKPSLQTIALSSQIQIITDPKQAPSNESLAAFAKSMGLDESAIQTLIAGGNPATLPNGGDVMPAALAGNEPLAQGVLPSGVQTNASPALLAALQPHTASQTTNADAVALNDLNINLTPQTNGLAQATSVGASLLAPQTQALPGALLPPMSAADLASIQQIQITVMPAAVAGVSNAVTSTSLPSTLDMLSLLTGDVKEQDISTLSAQFNSAGGNDQPADQQQSSSFGDNAPFAQVLGRQATNSSTPTTSAQVSTATHMAEVYDQLSDKLATEMAARMHKQLSDGEWKMKFGLRPAHLGGVEIQLEMKDGKLDAVFRADNPLTRDMLQNSSQRLREALENFGIHAGQVHVGQQGGNAQQNGSRNSANQPQVGDNSTLQVKGDASVASTSVASNKANASLLDLYA